MEITLFITPTIIYNGKDVKGVRIVPYLDPEYITDKNTFPLIICSNPNEIEVQGEVFVYQLEKENGDVQLELTEDLVKQIKKQYKDKDKDFAAFMRGTMYHSYKMFEGLR